MKMMLRGFTLIEMLIVTLIVLIIFYFVYSFFQQSEKFVRTQIQHSDAVRKNSDFYQIVMDDLGASLLSSTIIDSEEEREQDVLNDGRVNMAYADVRSGLDFCMVLNICDFDETHPGGGRYREQSGVYKVQYRLINGAIERYVQKAQWASGHIVWQDQGDPSMRPRVVFAGDRPGEKVTAFDVVMHRDPVEKGIVRNVDVSLTFFDGERERTFLQRFKL